MNKKIIVCAPLPPPNGGITNWYKILFSQAKDNGYDFVNINTSPKTKTNKRSVFYRVFAQGFYMLKSCREIKKVINIHNDAKVAHITTSGSLALIRDIAFLRIFKRKGIKTVFHIHFGRVPEIFNTKKFEYKMMSKALLLADDVIVIDPKTLSTLKQSSYKNKVHYVPNPVNKVVSQSNESKNEILFLGNVYKTKGIEELLTSWNEICGKHPEWKLKIVGSCEYDYSNYLRNNFSMKNVELYGYVEHDEAMELLAKTAFLVLPSYTEGFPNVVIEAMMSGKAVVATDVGAIDDILSGDCGIVIPPKNADELSKALDTLISKKEEREAMGIRGRIKALNNYTADVVFKQYEKIWREV